MDKHNNTLYLCACTPDYSEREKCQERLLPTTAHREPYIGIFDRLSHTILKGHIRVLHIFHAPCTTVVLGKRINHALS